MLKLFVVALVLVACVAAGPRSTRLRSNPEGNRITLAKHFNASPDGRFRLPNDTLPFRYDLKITTNIHQQNYDFQGELSIEFDALTSTRDIYLNSKGISVTRASLWDYPRGSSPIQDISSGRISYDTYYEFVIFALNSNLASGRRYILDISYTGKIRNDDSGGFYWREYSESGQRRIVAGTQFQATEARYAFPCYDEPQIRARFDITIVHGQALNAISNMPVKSRTVSNGYATTVFDTSPAMQSYIVAWVVSDFNSVTAPSSTPQRVYGSPNSVSSGQLNQAAQFSADILNYFDSFLNYKYSNFMPKIDHVAMPDHVSAAMENWGLALYRDYYLLWDAGKMPLSISHDCAAIQSHEITHMWFGDLVAPKWWSYLWLNEGFARMYETQGLVTIYPKFNDVEMFIYETQYSALTSDATGLTRPMTLYAEDPYDIDDLFDVVVYSKSAAVLKMLRDAFTEEAWRLGLSYYVQDMAFKAADADDLSRNLQRAVNERGVNLDGLTVKAIIDNWSLQAGAPIVTVSLDESSNVLTLRQNQFLTSSKTPQRYRNDNGMWHIPITIASASRPIFTDASAQFWMRTATMTRSSGSQHTWTRNDWFVVNTRFSGFYRVNYEAKLWDRLINVLNSASFNSIHHLSRGQLIDDAVNIAKAEQLSYQTVFRIFEYLPREQHFFPWLMADEGLVWLDRLLTDTLSDALMKSFIRELSTGIYSRYGPRDGGDQESLGEKYLRNIAVKWACKTGNALCISEARGRINDVIAGRISNIEPNLQAALFCAGIRESTTSEFNGIYNRMQSSSNTDERYNLIDALGCVKDSNQQKTYLATSLQTSGVSYSQRERERVLEAVYTEGGSNGILNAIDFFNRNYNDIERLYGGRLSNKALWMAEYVTSDTAYSQFNGLLSTLRSAGKITTNEQSTIQAVAKLNNDWVRTNEPSIRSYLQGRNKSKWFKLFM